MNEATYCETAPPANTAPLPHDSARWIAWAPLIFLPVLTIAFRARFLPWTFMWLLAVAVFASCKWLTWREASSLGVSTGGSR